MVIGRAVRSAGGRHGRTSTYSRPVAVAEQGLEPFMSGRLDVGHGHVLYYEQVGAPDGTPVVYLHGGPGSGCTPGTRRNFDLQCHRAVIFDQRAAGRSTPHASEDDVDWASIDMDHHVSDIERLRGQLGIEQWIVFGLSWGSVLGATYAERHPERVRALVLGAVSTGTADDIDWLTGHVGRFFPAEWRQFRDHVPAELRDLRLVDAYNTLLMDPNPDVREAAAVAWCRWEDAHVATTAGSLPNPRYADARYRLGFARQVTHCWRHNSWLDEDEIVRNAARLTGIPGSLIHGRLDLSGPLDAPWRIHQAWPGSQLIIVDDEGHGGRPWPCTGAEFSLSWRNQRVCHCCEQDWPGPAHRLGTEHHTGPVGRDPGQHRRCDPNRQGASICASGWRRRGTQKVNDERRRPSPATAPIGTWAATRHALSTGQPYVCVR
jgi:proline iminopeptidase